MQAGRMKVGVISGGKVGAVVGAALRSVGHEIVGVYASSPASIERCEAMLPGVPSASVEEIFAASEAVVLAVPDRELPGLVAGAAKLGYVRQGQILVHTAGCYGLEVLEPAREVGALTFALHPAMTFTGTSLDLQRLIGCPWAVTAAGPYAVIGTALVEEMGGVAVPVAEEKRGLYHAALVHGANHLVTLVAQAERLLEEAGIEDPGAFLRPLLQASLDGALESGEALATGPVQRGDVLTVRAHLSELEASAEPGAADAYRGLARLTAERAGVRRVLNDAQLNAVREALRS